MKGLCGAAVLALAILFTEHGARAGMFDQLPADARAQLERGEQVVRTKDMPGSAWPSVVVYQILAAPPEVAAAAFTNFGSQAGYLRDCCGVRQSVVRDPAVGGDARVQRVFYEIEVPIVSNDQYELVESLSKGDDGSFTVSWKKAGSGGHSEDISGRARFEPHGSGTLFYYYNFVKMNAFGAGLLSGKVVDRTKQTVGAMAQHIDELYASGDPALEADLARLRAAFGS